MKGFWVIVIMLITLMPLYMLSRKSEMSVEKPGYEVVSNEDKMVLPVIGED